MICDKMPRSPEGEGSSIFFCCKYISLFQVFPV